MIATCADCEEPYCSECEEPCLHKSLCKECADRGKCWECTDDMAEERDLNWLREA